jgi:alkaline phosphatase D
MLDMRSYKGPNPPADEPPPLELLGPEQLAWLKGVLRSSRATWKVIAADLPIGLVVPDGPDAIEAIGQRDGGQPFAREHEIADLLSFLKAEHIHDVVWLTADVHYCAAHHYDPTRAAFQDFDPFWEFVAGPLHAGTFGPNPLDATFGPEVRFQRAADRPNQPPSEGLQFFGHVTIPADSQVMTVELRDLEGHTLHREDLEPTAPS